MNRERSGEAEYGAVPDRWLEPFPDAFRHKVSARVGTGLFARTVGPRRS